MKRTALPPRRSPLRKVSSKRQRELREYSTKREAFLAAHPFCQITIERHGFNEACVIAEAGNMSVPNIDYYFTVPRSVEIHHKAKRNGSRLNDETHWLAVSREAHEWIHANPTEARRRGWLV